MHSKSFAFFVDDKNAALYEEADEAQPVSGEKPTPAAPEGKEEEEEAGLLPC